MSQIGQSILTHEQQQPNYKECDILNTWDTQLRPILRLDYIFDLK
jgi:hypothetical protein